MYQLANVCLRSWNLKIFDSGHFQNRFETPVHALPFPFRARHSILRGDSDKAIAVTETRPGNIE
jgi:hypothetical protein